jgi:cytochrome c-type biogenesis protein CcmH/NrfG
MPRGVISMNKLKKIRTSETWKLMFGSRHVDRNWRQRIEREIQENTNAIREANERADGDEKRD